MICNCTECMLKLIWSLLDFSFRSTKQFPSSEIPIKCSVWVVKYPFDILNCERSDSVYLYDQIFDFLNHISTSQQRGEKHFKCQHQESINFFWFFLCAQVLKIHSKSVLTVCYVLPNKHFLNKAVSLFLPNSIATVNTKKQGPRKQERDLI